MSAISKFMFAENPMNEDDLREFILHTEHPKFLVEVQENNLGYSFKLVQSYDDLSKDEFDELVPELEIWWDNYLDWEESIDNEE